MDIKMIYILFAIILAFNMFFPELLSAVQLQESSIQYLGSFKIPLTSSSGKSYQYGAWGIGFYNDPTHGPSLFVRGHDTDNGSIGQLSIPATLSTDIYANLPQSTEIQPLTDITDGIGHTGLYTGESEWEFYGILPYNGRLILGATTDYITADGQTATHAASGLDLSVNNDFTGYESFGGSGYTSRYIGGYMATIPTNKQTLFGGAKAVTGGVAHSIVSTTSLGPALNLFDPDKIDTEPSPHPVTTLLRYSSASGTGLSSSCPNTGMCEDVLFNVNSVVGGVIIPSEYDTVLFIGSHDIADNDGFCYSTVECCSSNQQCDSSGFSPTGPYTGYNTPVCTDGKGEHSDSMSNVMWAYNLNDLVAVYNGTKTVSEPVPQLWTNVMAFMNSGACAPRVKGVAYDDVSRKIYVAAGSNPQIYVFKINSFAGKRYRYLSINQN